MNQTQSTRGGARPNAGRPRGSCNARTRQIADEAIRTGLSPLEVMLAVMRRLYEAGDDKGAAQIASSAAPFVHPRLQAVQLEPSTQSNDAFVVSWRGRADA
jgi:hypothetical protein